MWGCFDAVCCHYAVRDNRGDDALPTHATPDLFTWKVNSGPVNVQC